MRLPTNVVTIAKQTNIISLFGGINETSITGDNEFSDMLNMSSDLYPGLTNRQRRGSVIKTVTKPNGLFWKNGLLYIDGTDVYYKDSKIGTVTDSEKKIVGMGAYICIWPDKKVYNTADKTWKDIEASYTQTGSLSVAPVSDASTYVKISGDSIGTHFERYDAVTIAGFTTNGDLLNVSKVIQEKGDNYIVVIAAGASTFTQTSGVQMKRTAPDLDFVCEFNNRIWGCSSTNREIYASKLGDPCNWNSFEGISTDSYAVSIGSDGDFTGCIAHQGYVIFFKEDVIHTIYGSKPSNYQVDTIQLRGVAKGCEKSLCRVDETVYYASRNDICAFEGSVPETISNKLQIKYQAAAAQQYDSKLYISLQDKDGVWHLYVYDAARSQAGNTALWYKEDNLQIRFSCFAEGKLYLIDGSGNLREIYDDGHEKTMEWMATSGIIEEGSLQKKKIHKLQLNIELGDNAIFQLYVRYDSNPKWILCRQVINDQRKTYVIPMKLNRCSNYQYRIHGYGECKVFGMARIVEGGSDR